MKNIPTTFSEHGLNFNSLHTSFLDPNQRLQNVIPDQDPNFLTL